MPTGHFACRDNPLIPALFILAALAVVIHTAITQPLRAAVGLGAVALGIPVFFIWKARVGRMAKPIGAA